MIQEVFITDVLDEIVGDMQVPIPGSAPVSYFDINYEPGRATHIIDSLRNLDAASQSSLKYPLCAVLMPFSEGVGSPYREVTFSRIVFAHLTKTNTNSEKVMDKYSSDGVFKTILRPCVIEFIKRLAFSKYTNMGDPEMYEYTILENPNQQPIGEGTTDFVDIIEIRNLKATIFHQIKTC